MPERGKLPTNTLITKLLGGGEYTYGFLPCPLWAGLRLLRWALPAAAGPRALPRPRGRAEGWAGGRALGRARPEERPCAPAWRGTAGSYQLGLPLSSPAMWPSFSPALLLKFSLRVPSVKRRAVICYSQSCKRSRGVRAQLALCLWAGVLLFSYLFMRLGADLCLPSSVFLGLRAEEKAVAPEMIEIYLQTKEGEERKEN